MSYYPYPNTVVPGKSHNSELPSTSVLDIDGFDADRTTDLSGLLVEAVADWAVSRFLNHFFGVAKVSFGVSPRLLHTAKKAHQH